MNILIRPIPHADESPAGVLIRTAQENLYPTVHPLFSIAKVNSHGSLNKFYSSEALIDIFNVLQIKAETLRGNLGRHGATIRCPRRFNGSAYPEEMFRRDGTAFCVACLQEEVYWRNLWMIKPYTTCHIHGTVIVERCEQCGKIPNNSRGKLVSCSYCKFDFRNSTATVSDDISSSWIAQLLLGKDTLLQTKFSGFYVSINKWAKLFRKEITEKEKSQLSHLYFTAQTAAKKMFAKMVLAVNVHPAIQIAAFFQRSNKVVEFADAVVEDIRINGLEFSTSSEKCRISQRRAWEPCPFPKERCRKTLRLLKLPQEDSAEILTENQHTNTNPVSKKRDQSISHVFDETLSVKAVSEKFGVNQDVVRTLYRHKFLNFLDTVVNRKRLMLTSQANLDQFNKDYIFVRPLAKKLNVNVHYTKEILLQLGVAPVMCSANGLRTTLYRREDVKHLEPKDVAVLTVVRDLRKQSKKPKVVAFSSPGGMMPIMEAAARLKINMQKTATLLQRGILEKVRDTTDKVYVTDVSLTALLDCIDSKNFVTVERAAMELQMTTGQMGHKFVSTGIVNVRDFHYWKMVSVSDLVKMKQFHSQYLTTAEGSALFGMHRSHLTNLHKQGLIKSFHDGPEKSLRFFRREDVQALLDKHILH